MNSGDTFALALGGAVVVYYIIAIAICALTIIAWWKIFTKAGEPGWKSLIPGYSYWVLCQIVTGKGANMFRILIPFYGEVYAIILMVKLCKAFGKSGGFCVGMVFLSTIFTLILGFDSSTYIGPQ